VTSMSVDDTFLDEYRQLKSWLLGVAYPLWWQRGADHEAGGFHERLTLDAMPTGEARRARLHPRQMYAFGAAKDLGWDGPADEGVRHALDFFITHYFRNDGLVRAAVDPQGTALSESVVLYDQAFALLGFAAAYAALRDETYRDSARVLRQEIISAFSHDRGFDETLDRAPPLLANSHMHLLEACLAWRELDSGWDDIAASIVALVFDSLLNERLHAITEFFARDWTPLAGDHGRIVEPGHQFEWAWLLMRSGAVMQQPELTRRALQLVDTTELHVHSRRQVAMNSLVIHGDALIVRDANARLWPQTERIKANLLAARATGDTRYVIGAARALASLRAYLEVPTPGLWRDTMTVDGTFAIEPAPASSFYHIVCAAQECERYARMRFGT
jgi:mannose/cellobiose epimerase-like protein (N-acyl-D-glucosamine 2-epimerase family)